MAEEVSSALPQLALLRDLARDVPGEHAATADAILAELATELEFDEDPMSVLPAETRDVDATKTFGLALVTDRRFLFAGTRDSRDVFHDIPLGAIADASLGRSGRRLRVVARSGQSLDLLPVDGASSAIFLEVLRGALAARGALPVTDELGRSRRGVRQRWLVVAATLLVLLVVAGAIAISPSSGPNRVATVATQPPADEQTGSTSPRAQPTGVATSVTDAPDPTHEGNRTTASSTTADEPNDSAQADTTEAGVTTTGAAGVDTTTGVSTTEGGAATPEPTMDVLPASETSAATVPSSTVPDTTPASAPSVPPTVATRAPATPAPPSTTGSSGATDPPAAATVPDPAPPPTTTPPTEPPATTVASTTATSEPTTTTAPDTTAAPTTAPAPPPPPPTTAAAVCTGAITSVSPGTAANSADGHPAPLVENVSVNIWSSGPCGELWIGYDSVGGGTRWVSAGGSTSVLIATAGGQPWSEGRHTIVLANGRNGTPLAYGTLTVA